MSPEEFWASLDRSGECWTWTRGNNGRNGHGKVYLRWDASRQRSIYVYAHRLAYTLANGPIPDGLVVCHACDNPPYCNPAHLFLGSVADNNKDAGEKGLMSRDTRGDRNPAHKLTRADIQPVLALHASGLSMTAIARRYGVSRHAISLAVRGRTWKESAA
jgi:hypothetical protein